MASAKLVQSKATQPDTVDSISKAARGFMKTARYTVTGFGVSAIAVVALLYTSDSFAKRVSEMLHPQPALALEEPSVETQLAQATSLEPAQPVAEKQDDSAEETSALLGTSKQQQWVTKWLSKRYRVASDATNMLVSTAYLTAHEVKLDPLLILAVMAIESGLNPFAESPMGAKGLMQVMAKVHHDKFEQVGGQKAALNPVANIRVGAQILKDYVKRTGSVEGGLKTYVGAADMASDSGYGARVLAEYRRLKMVAKGQHVPVRTPAAPKAVVAKQDKAESEDAVKPAVEETVAEAPSLAGL